MGEYFRILTIICNIPTQDDYCAISNVTAIGNASFHDIGGTFSKSQLMATLEVSAAEFLSIPIFAILVEKLGRVKTGMVLGKFQALIFTFTISTLTSRQ